MPVITSDTVLDGPVQGVSEVKLGFRFSVHKTARLPIAKAENAALIFTLVCLFKAYLYTHAWIYIYAQNQEAAYTELKFSDKA